MLFVALGIVVVLLVMLVAAAVKVVKPGTVAVVERSGRFQRLAQPGVLVMLPFVDRIRAHVTNQPQVLIMPSRPLATSDGGWVTAPTTVHFAAVDPVRATYEIASPALALTNAGIVTTQGDIAMRSNVARTTFGTTGSGVTVGVLSDSYNCLGGAALDIANGDLPPVALLQEEPGCSSSGTEEGRAMLQIVHDIAPGAALAFATAFAGKANFTSNIVALKNSGSNVIVARPVSTATRRAPIATMAGASGSRPSRMRSR